MDNIVTLIGRELHCKTKNYFVM